MNEASITHREVGKGSSYIFTGELIAQISSLVILFAITHTLSVSQVGIISAIQLILSFTTVAGLLGLQYGVAKYIRLYLSQGKFGEAATVYRKLIVFGFLLSFIASTILFILISILFTIILNPVEIGMLLLIAVMDLIFLMLTLLFSGSLYGLQRFKEISYGRILGSISRTLLVIILLLMGYGIFSVFFGWVLGDGIVFMVYGFSASRRLRVTPSQLSIKQVISYSIPLGGWDVSQKLSEQLDRYLILILAGAFALGLYAPAVFLGSALFLIPLSLRGPLFTLFTDLSTRNHNEIERVLNLSSRYLFLIYTPIAFLATLISPFLVIFLLGLNYITTIFPLSILLLFSTITCLTTILEAVILSFEKSSSLVFANVGGVIISFLTSLLLIPFIGLIGAALARSSATLMILFLEYLSARRTTKLVIDWRMLGYSWLASLIMGIPFLLAWIFVSSFWIMFIALGLGILFYVITIRKSKAVTKEDAHFFSSILPNIIRMLAFRIMVFLLIPRDDEQTEAQQQTPSRKAKEK